MLATLVLLPAVGALLVVLWPRSRSALVRPVAVLVSSATGVVSVVLLVRFDKADAGFQFASHQEWLPDFGISWFLGVDGISLFMVVLTGLLFPIAMVATSPHHDVKPYYAWLLVLEAGCMGVFLALDLFLFFVFFEVVLVPMYFLIGGWGYRNRVYAAVKFFLFTLFGSALMLVGILALVFLTSSATGDAVTFNVVELADAQALPVVTARWIFLSFALAFAVKVPLVPIHTWLPDAHTEAPTAGSVILAGVLLKLGTYGFLRFGLYLFPEASVYFAPLLVTLGVVGILYAAVVATMQGDLKRLVAYSSVAHLGFIVLGTFALTTEAVQGGVMQMVSHGLTTGALFILVGWIYERTGTRRISELGGLQKVVPIMAAVFTLVMLSSIGLPGLSGFVGEFLILIGSFITVRWWAVVGAFGIILASLYLLWAYQRVFHGAIRPEHEGLVDLRPREALVMAPIVALIVFLGVYPGPMLDRIEPAVDALIDHVEQHSDYEQPDTGGAVEVEAADETEEGGG